MKVKISIIIISVLVVIMVFNSEVTKVDYYMTIYGDVVINSETELRIKGLPQNIKGMRGEYFVLKTNDNNPGKKQTDIVDYTELNIGDRVEILYCDKISKKIWKNYSELYMLSENKEIPKIQYIKKIEK